MNWADYFMIAVVAISVAISVIRGFAKEALSLATWVAAFWCVAVFTNDLAPFFAESIETPSLRGLVAGALIFIATLIGGSILAILVGKSLANTGLSPTDRAIGSLFGAARGIAIVTLLVMLGGYTGMPRDDWWRESRLLPYVQPMASWLRARLDEAREAR